MISKKIYFGNYVLLLEDIMYVRVLNDVLFYYCDVIKYKTKITLNFSKKEYFKKLEKTATFLFEGTKEMIDRKKESPNTRTVIELSPIREAMLNNAFDWYLENRIPIWRKMSRGGDNLAEEVIDKFEEMMSVLND